MVSIYIQIIIRTMIVMQINKSLKLKLLPISSHICPKKQTKLRMKNNVTIYLKIII